MNWLYLCVRWLVFSHVILNSQEIFFSKTDFGRLVGFEKKCLFCMFFFFLSLSLFLMRNFDIRTSMFAFHANEDQVCLFLWVSVYVCVCVCGSVFQSQFFLLLHHLTQTNTRVELLAVKENNKKIWQPTQNK